jgi:hypothetical protein
MPTLSIFLNQSTPHLLVTQSFAFVVAHSLIISFSCPRTYSQSIVSSSTSRTDDAFLGSERSIIATSNSRSQEHDAVRNGLGSRPALVRESDICHLFDPQIRPSLFEMAAA